VVAVPSAPSESVDELVGRVQELQERLESAGDPETRAIADELLSAVVRMYGAGLERVVEVVAEADERHELARTLADDPLVATLLMIHDLHPVPLEARVAEALESVRPYMESHGGNVELLDLVDGVARIRLQGSCSSCSASSVTLELAIKQALEDAAPDLDGLEVEGIEEAEAGAVPTAAAVARIERLPLAPAPTPSWFEVDRLAGLAPGELTTADIAGAALVVANVEGTLLAFRDACAGCGEPLHDGRLEAGVLRCRSCARTYYLPRAGRSMDADRLQLDPVPLLRDQGVVKVALAT
jgi:Fe-S cluster biogenesis protein NfuA/nitrite reductase/ring-hydroxylating ferredoxin subunit